MSTDTCHHYTFCIYERKSSINCYKHCGVISGHSFHSIPLCCHTTILTQSRYLFPNNGHSFQVTAKVYEQCLSQLYYSMTIVFLTIFANANAYFSPWLVLTGSSMALWLVLSVHSKSSNLSIFCVELGCWSNAAQLLGWLKKC